MCLPTTTTTEYARIRKRQTVGGVSCVVVGGEEGKEREARRWMHGPLAALSGVSSLPHTHPDCLIVFLFSTLDQGRKRRRQPETRTRERERGRGEKKQQLGKRVKLRATPPPPLGGGPCFVVCCLFCFLAVHSACCPASLWLGSLLLLLPSRGTGQTTRYCTNGWAAASSWFRAPVPSWLFLRSPSPLAPIIKKG